MSIFIGVTLAIIIGGFATIIGFDRERGFYPFLMIVIASIYVLFSILDGTPKTMYVELFVMFVFSAVSIVGFKKNAWIIVGALVMHGLFDAFHGDLIINQGVPSWYRSFCISYDIVAAGYLAIRLTYSGSQKKLRSTNLLSRD
ncbi:hypothetical protein [Undibacterium parvum]|uniref:hypothetical protein n=1 Tax=Undibacterium parvum TaxID=401471 RepID=UPI00188218E4|nr:hypothetical protein [Undibacterium parvum]MCX7219514.1 hypothetical protein [Burkholderiales bacterium]